MRLRHLFGIGCAITAMAAVAPPAVSAEGGQAAAAVARAPHPDFTGNWGAPWRKDLESIPLLNVPMPEMPDYTPEYEKKFEENLALAAATESPEGAGAENLNNNIVQYRTNCRPQGMPDMMGAMYSIEILQVPARIVVVSEIMGDVRRIYIGKKQLPLDEIDPGYWGRSVAEWEGDVLVVSTIGIKETVLGPYYMPHSDKMVITERISLKTPDILYDEVTITDPVALKTPYKYTIPMKRMVDYETPEFVCDNHRENIDAQGRLHMELKK